MPERFEAGRVTETWLAKTPLRNHKALAVPFMPATWRNFGRSDAEWILCSSRLFAHHARFKGAARDAPKYVYTHTPARYIWAPELDVRGSGAIARVVSRPLQELDRLRAQKAYSIASNSAFVATRVEQAWGRESIVIHPPVSVQDFANDFIERVTEEEEKEAILNSLPETFILGASRFVPYKRLDVAIKAGVASGVQVVIADEGPDEARLRAIADHYPGMVTFVSKPSFAPLNQPYRRALVFIFPAVEDFGIMPVEAMAAGTPVIAKAVGGVVELVQHEKTGAVMQNFDRSSLIQAVNIAANAERAACTTRAWKFDAREFDAKIKARVGV